MTLRGMILSIMRILRIDTRVQYGFYPIGWHFIQVIQNVFCGKLQDRSGKIMDLARP
jgi:hypothetical protein